ncbi:MAG: hypothetical protein M1818_007006 [Claussenomyces sp. TS43310]|nr:MAG: hypothetical protein M1818_007006 [Claussenomyces sp. TS43310]
MPPNHKWTAFEQRALLCLLCRNVHVTGIIASEADEDITVRGLSRGAGGDQRKKRQTAGARKRCEVSKQHAYMDVATLLNRAVNGAGEYGQDIPAKEIAEMIERVLRERKAAVGVMGRLKTGRLTRLVRRVWERRLGFEGTEREWKEGRREVERERQVETRIAGVLPSVDPAIGCEVPGRVMAEGDGANRTALISTVDGWPDTVVQEAPSANVWGGEAPITVPEVATENIWGGGASTTASELPSGSGWGGLASNTSSLPTASASAWDVVSSTGDTITSMPPAALPGWGGISTTGTHDRIANPQTPARDAWSVQATNTFPSNMTAVNRGATQPSPTPPSRASGHKAWQEVAGTAGGTKPWAKPSAATETTLSSDAANAWTMPVSSPSNSSANVWGAAAAASSAPGKAVPATTVAWGGGSLEQSAAATSGDAWATAPPTTSTSHPSTATAPTPPSAPASPQPAA